MIWLFSFDCDLGQAQGILHKIDGIDDGERKHCLVVTRGCGCFEWK